MKKFVAMFLAGSACALATQASAQVLTAAGGDLTGIIVRQGVPIDFANAKPMPLPMSRIAPPSQLQALLEAAKSSSAFGTPGGVPGAAGDGKLKPVMLFTPSSSGASSNGGIVPQEYGTANQVFTTSRVNANGDTTVNYYPFRAAGKLFFNKSTGSFVCSAALVQPGLVVTAAHCVANYGKSTFYSGWQFVPAYQNGSGAYGTHTAYTVWIKTSYYNGTDGCYQTGVICPNDVAIIVLNTTPGTSTGYFGTYWNGGGFNGFSQALINQLGYPVALDSGNLMLRNDSQSFKSSSMSNNNIIGSLMTGGSSGGPWLVNLGARPALGCDSKGCTVAGTGAAHNRVVGVTSWGYDPNGSGNYVTMQQGASPFTNVNICSLMKSGCTSRPSACAITAASLNC